jgi:hypothetical protein
MNYPQLTFESFQRKLLVFGLTLKTRKDIEKYPMISLSAEYEVASAPDAVFERVNEAYTWLDETLGDNWIWSTSLVTGRPDIYFLNQEDAFLFKLRFTTA